MSDIISTEAIEILNNAVSSLQTQKSSLASDIQDLRSQESAKQVQSDNLDKAITDINGVIAYLQTPATPTADPGVGTDSPPAENGNDQDNSGEQVDPNDPANLTDAEKMAKGFPVI